MLNRWLLYQTLACRVWARTALLPGERRVRLPRPAAGRAWRSPSSRPDLTRAHILRAAARQFVEGDVQHWWHEPAGRGVRTRISDDLLWLPYVGEPLRRRSPATAAVLDERVPFLEGRAARGRAAGVVLRAARLGASGRRSTSTARARIDRSLGVGRARSAAHGHRRLERRHEPRRRRGQGGERLARVVPARGPRRRGRRSRRPAARRARADAWAARAAALTGGGRARRLGRRAGTGARTSTTARRSARPRSDACAIDSIAQTWSVISGAGDPERARLAMASLDRAAGAPEDDRMVLLLTPPFDHTALEPGYIKGYVPGVRENGGQYTHAAAWAVHRVRRARATATRPPSCSRCSIRSRTRRRPPACERYRVEPYVVAGDVYSASRRTSAAAGGPGTPGRPGWLYRAGVEWLLGVRLRGDRLLIDPCIPAAWPGFSATIRYRSARYEVAVENPRRRLPRGVRGSSWTESRWTTVRACRSRTTAASTGSVPCWEARARRPPATPTCRPSPRRRTNVRIRCGGPDVPRGAGRRAG